MDHHIRLDDHLPLPDKAHTAHHITQDASCFTLSGCLTAGVIDSFGFPPLTSDTPPVAPRNPSHSYRVVGGLDATIRQKSHPSLRQKACPSGPPPGHATAPQCKSEPRACGVVRVREFGGDGRASVNVDIVNRVRSREVLR